LHKLYNQWQGGIMSMHADSPIDSLSSLIFIAFALGLDGFSVSLSIGLQKIRYRKMALIGIVIGLFHFLMPFSGMVIGQFLSIQMSEITSLLGSILLVFIGAYMFFSAWKDTGSHPVNPHHPLKIVSVAFAVSLDSFPVGLSLGLYGMKSFFVILTIAFIAMMTSLAGMLLGGKAKRLFGVYSETLGGIVIFLFGLKGLF